MENILTSLFDYQSFEGNRDLQRVIESVHSRYAVRELGPEELTGSPPPASPRMTRRKPAADKRRGLSRRSCHPAGPAFPGFVFFYTISP